MQSVAKCAPRPRLKVSIRYALTHSAIITLRIRQSALSSKSDVYGAFPGGALAFISGPGFFCVIRFFAASSLFLPSRRLFDNIAVAEDAPAHVRPPVLIRSRFLSTSRTLFALNAHFFIKIKNGIQIYHFADGRCK